jgi:hypothetical protein
MASSKPVTLPAQVSSLTLSRRIKGSDLIELVRSLSEPRAEFGFFAYGNADGLLSAAMVEAFSQFLESKKAAVQSPDPVTALREGWDDYVRFAARPHYFDSPDPGSHSSAPM